MKGSYLGPDYSQSSIEKSLNDCGAKYELLSEEEMLERTADALVQGKAIGWFQGRMEFGPRSLGGKVYFGGSSFRNYAKNTQP